MAAVGDVTHDADVAVFVETAVGHFGANQAPLTRASAANAFGCWVLASMAGGLLLRRMLDVETLVSLVVDDGIDTFLVTDDEDEMRTFMREVAPRVRDEVDERRARSAH